MKVFHIFFCFVNDLSWNYKQKVIFKFLPRLSIYLLVFVSQNFPLFVSYDLVKSINISHSQSPFPVEIQSLALPWKCEENNMQHQHYYSVLKFNLAKHFNLFFIPRFILYFFLWMFGWKIFAILCVHDVDFFVWIFPLIQWTLKTPFNSIRHNFFYL